MTGHGGGSRHFRAHKMRASATSLATFEIAVRGRGAALALGQLVRVHRKAHGTSRLAPFETGSREHLVESLGLGLLLYKAGARNDHRADAVGDLVALDELRGLDVLDRDDGLALLEVVVVRAWPLEGRDRKIGPNNRSD